MRNYFLFCFVAFALFLSNSAASQSPTFQKVFPHGEYGNFFWNVGAFATTSDDGGYLVTTSVSSNPGTNLKLLKTDENGDTLWTSEIETPSELHNATSITSTIDGEYFIQGTYDVEGTNYQDEVFVEKFDNNGNSVDYNQLTSTGICCWDYSTGKMIHTSDDHYFLTGQYFGISDNYGTYYKIDDSGIIQWSGVFDGMGGANVARSIELSDGGFLLGGNYLLASVQEAYVQKIDENGDYVWGENFLHQDTQTGTKNKIFDMVEVSDGYILAINYEADDNENLQLRKVDFDGNTVWTENFIGKGNNIDLIATDDGGVVFAGYKSQALTDYDFRLFKMDSEFNIVFELFYGTENPDVLHSLEQTPDNGFLLAGRSGSLGVGNKDVYLVKTDSAGCLSNDTEFSYAADGSSQIAFFDESSFGVLSDSETHLWDFGDGTTSSNQNPVHIFETPGIYEVCLTAGNVCGSSTTCQTVEFCPQAEVNSTTETACDSFAWNGSTYFESGIYLDTLTSAFGCDSIVELNLTINTVDFSVLENDTSLTAISEEATLQWLDCDNDFAEVPNETSQTFQPETTGNYAVQITHESCIDTSDCYYIFICTSETYLVEEEACYEFTWNGNTYSESGVYIDTLVNSVGCDSIIELDLTINSVDIFVSQNDSALYSDTENAEYQWLDCNDKFAEIPGETNQYFYPEITGSYALEITQNGCTEISDCYPIMIISVSEAELKNKSLIAYPNPSDGKITVERLDAGSQEDLPYEIKDMTGKIVLRGVLRNHDNFIDLHKTPPGMYLLKLEDQTIKLMVY
ncbi:PKD domain-containing protein [Halocola ammonii]